MLFFETYRTIGTLLGIFLAGWLACYLIAALAAGQPFHLGLMARATASTLPVLPIASLTLALFLRVRRLLWRVPLFVALVIGVPILQVIFVKTCLDRAFTPLPLAIYTTVTALAIWLCWRVSQPLPDLRCHAARHQSPRARHRLSPQPPFLPKHNQYKP